MSRKSAGPYKPKKVNGQLNIRAAYYKKDLMQRTMGIFDVNIPKDWDYCYFMQVLLRYGLIGITDSPIGVKPFKCTTYGVNYMNNPTNIEIATPIFSTNLQREIGKDCELIFLDRFYYSKEYFTFMALIDIYSELLASADIALAVNLMNAKLSYIGEAQSKAQSETIKALFDDVMDGNPLVVYRSGTIDSSGLQMFFNNLKQNFIAGDIQDVRRTIVNDYLTRIGVNNANTDKKERLITTEVDSNNQELMCNTSVWAKNLEIQLKKVHSMFPELKGKFDIKLKFREELIKENESKRNDNDMGAGQSGKEPVRRNESP